MSESLNQSNSIPSRVGDYIIDYSMRSGGMGSVYRARQISMHRFVALKVIRHALLWDDPAYAARFQQEIHLLAQLEHPNIVQILEAGTDKGLLFFAMEFVNGNDLRTCLRMRRTFSEIGVLKIARQVAAGLDYAYARFQIIHRDVKPGNIMLDRSGSVKLLDLGVSCTLRGIESGCGRNKDSITKRNEFVGTPRYVSPEQACGAEIDFHADVYSLGVTMFELLAGVPPYDSSNAEELIRRHLHDPVPNVRKWRKDVSNPTANLICRMMSKDPLERCGTWKTLIEEFDERISVLERIAKRRNEQIRRRFLTPKVKICTTAFLLLLIGACFLWSATADLRKKWFAGRASASDASQEVSSFSLDAATKNISSLIENVDQAFRQWRSRDSNENADASRSQEILNAELMEIDRKSLNLEMEQRYAEALKLWQAFLNRPEVMRNPQVRSRVESSIQYLHSSLERRNSDMDD